MELIKNIFFNTDKLIENSVVKISYTGKFFQDNSNTELYIHYGFGLLWENVNEIKMEKTELGYQALIYLNGQDSLNFCFKNGKGEWDNNEGKNYVFEIAPLPKGKKERKKGGRQSGPVEWEEERRTGRLGGRGRGGPAGRSRAGRDRTGQWAGERAEPGWAGPGRAEFG